jgi:hypothetical protein
MKGANGPTYWAYRHPERDSRSGRSAAHEHGFADLVKRDGFVQSNGFAQSMRLNAPCRFGKNPAREAP